MAISQAMATSFKVQILAGDFDFASGTSQTFYCALYTSSATLGATTTAYTASNEVSGTGYSATGKQLTISQVPTSTGTTAFLDFSNLTWGTSTITARGALIYLKNAVGVISFSVKNFDSDKTSDVFILLFFFNLSIIDIIDILY